MSNYVRYMYATSTYVTVPLPKPLGSAKSYRQDFIFWKLPSSIIHPTIQPSIRAHKIVQNSFILSLFILPAVPIGKQRRWKPERKMTANFSKKVKTKRTQFHSYINLKKEKWYQHRPQTVQVNQCNQRTLTTSLLFGSFCDAQSMKSILKSQCQALFCSSPMIHIWDTHEDKQTDIIKTWRKHVQCRPYTWSQIRAQHSTARPPACPVYFFLR